MSGRGSASNSLTPPPDPRAREVEAAILGARLAAGFGVGQGLAFLPLTLTGFSALSATGPAERRLAGWIAGGIHTALLHNSDIGGFTL